MLESRQLLSTITWNNTAAPTGGDWDMAANWSPAQVPGAGDDAVINLPSAGTVLLSSNRADAVHSLATNANTTLTVDNGSISLGAGSSTLGGPVNVGQGAALSVGAGGSVSIGVTQTITDDGTLTFGSGDSVSFATASQETTQIVVNSGGVMNASSTSFTNGYTIDAYFSFNQIVINSGGELVATDSNFGKLSDQGGPVNKLVLNSGSSATLHFNVFSAQLAINSGAMINISGNDFSKVGTNGIIATGVSTASIPLPENYWATTDTTQIGTLILDHLDDGTRPTVDFQPFWSNNYGTIASPAFAAYSLSDQTVNLSATVSTTGGIPINEGTETFTIMNGTQVIGQTTAAASVVNGSVTASYTLPGGTPVGKYEIVASCSGTSNYPASTDTSQVLLVYPGPATQLVMQVEPSVTATAGQAFSTQPVIYEEDPDGDLETYARQHHHRDRLAQYRRRSASGNVDGQGHRGHRDVLKPRRPVGRDHLDQFHQRNSDRGHLNQHRRKPGGGDEAGDRATAAGNRDGGAGLSHPNRLSWKRTSTETSSRAIARIR